MNAMKTIMLATVAAAAVVANASAQQSPTYTFERKVASNEAQAVLDKVKAEQAWKVALETKAVANAPYSAETVNETVQLLADGNRIVNRSTSRVYRDAAGRVRRETLDGNGDVTLTSITDPTTGTSYLVSAKGDSVSQGRMALLYTPTEQVVTGEATAITSARAGEPLTWTYSLSDKTRTETEVNQTVIKEKEVIAGRVSAATGGARVVITPAAGETTKEDLGRQMIEGVTATGTRSTTTIPAGAIGNEQPIKIVSEEWFSPDLQVLVLTRHSDPRTGETTYRLMNINRAEPPKSLFDPPAVK